MAAFKVIIVGGSVAGLTLANILERYRIDYIILEKHASVTPQLGASLGFLPPGARILDQLGLFSKLEGISMSIDENQMVGPDGLPLGPPQQVGELMEELLGYRMRFLDRQDLLQVLFDGIRDKSKIKLSCEVVNIKVLDGVAEVLLADDTIVRGDIVVGADGVHSCVRTELWRISNTEMNYNSARAKLAILSTYKCIFGTSKRPDGIPDNVSFRCCHKNRSYFCASGPMNKVYFFGFFKNPIILAYQDMPLYTAADAKDLVAAYASDPLFHGLTFGDIHDLKIQDYILVPLEEFVLEKCFYKRCILIGDSFHKMNPLGGQGGNSAIESAATLADLLKKMCGENRCPTNDMIERIFSEFQECRRGRTMRLMKFTQTMQRMESLENPFLEFLQLNIIPKLGGEHIVSVFASESTPGNTLAYLPRTYHRGMISLDQEVNANPSERSILVTLLWDAVMFGIAIMSSVIFCYVDAAVTFEEAQPLEFYIFSITIVVNGMWVVESYRPGHLITPLFSATPYILISSLFGLRITLPIYFALHAYVSGKKAFYFPTPRGIDPRVAKALPGALLIVYAPFIAQATVRMGPSQEINQRVSMLGHLSFPVLLQLGGQLYRRLSPQLSAGQLLFQSRDMKYLFRFFGVIAFVTGTAHLIFVSKLFTLVSSQMSNTETVIPLYLFQIGTLTFLINIWCLFVVWDLRRVNLTEVTLPVTLLRLILGSVLLGPATMLAVLWMWRDLVMQKGRQRQRNTSRQKDDARYRRFGKF